MPPLEIVSDQYLLWLSASNWNAYMILVYFFENFVVQIWLNLIKWLMKRVSKMVDIFTILLLLPLFLRFSFRSIEHIAPLFTAFYRYLNQNLNQYASSILRLFMEYNWSLITWLDWSADANACAHCKMNFSSTCCSIKVLHSVFVYLNL